MISIIIPTYNHARSIGACLDSILGQTETDWEVIVVNDGSSDATLSILEAYAKKFPAGRFEVYSKPNEGSNPARNDGAARARGSCLLFSDDDIVMKPDMLEKMRSALEANPAASFVYCSFRYGLKKFRLFPYSAERLRAMPYIHSTSLMRREHFPGFDNAIKRLQDWDLWLTMLENGRFGVWIDEVLFTVRTGGHISSWLPSAAYRFMPFLSSVRKYQAAYEIIKTKHRL